MNVMTNDVSCSDEDVATRAKNILLPVSSVVLQDFLSLFKTLSWFCRDSLAKAHYNTHFLQGFSGCCCLKGGMNRVLKVALPDRVLCQPPVIQFQRFSTICYN